MNGPGPTSLCAAFCTVLRYRVSTRRVHVGRACTSLLAIRQRHAKRQPRENAIWLIGHCSDHRYTTCKNYGCWPWCCCCCEATLRGPSCTDRSWVRSRKPSSQTHRARHNSRRMLRLSTTLHLQTPKPAHSFHIPKWSAQSLRACSLTLRALKRPRRCHAADKSATPKLRPRL